jgi:hypothetical protein
MKLFNLILGGSLLVTGSLAAPTATSPECVVPMIAFASVPTPFTLVVQNPKELTVNKRIVNIERDEDGGWTPILEPMGEPAKFIMKDGHLFVADDKKPVSPSIAYDLPMIEIFPPPLRKFRFGSDGLSEGLKFTASFKCDGVGKSEIVIRPNDTNGKNAIAKTGLD